MLKEHLWYSPTHFTLEPCNFTLNIFQDFVLHILNKKDNVYATIDF